MTTDSDPPKPKQRKPRSTRIAALKSQLADQCRVTLPPEETPPPDMQLSVERQTPLQHGMEILAKYAEEESAGRRKAEKPNLNVVTARIPTLKEEIDTSMRAVISLLASTADQAETIAKYRRAIYDAHIKQGFTADQAWDAACRGVAISS